jgi:hypothetical protein
MPHWHRRYENTRTIVGAIEPQLSRAEQQRALRKP